MTSMYVTWILNHDPLGKRKQLVAVFKSTSLDYSKRKLRKFGQQGVITKQTTGLIKRNGKIVYRFDGKPS